MKIIKRNKTEVDFDITKIVNAVTKANNAAKESERMTSTQIKRIADSVEKQCEKVSRALSVEEIQDLVEKQIMAHGAYEVAKLYITYRYTRTLVRQSNTTDDSILTLIECNNEELKQENSNKNPTVNSVQRDYMAGEVSKDITKRFLLDEDIVKALESEMEKTKENKELTEENKAEISVFRAKISMMKDRVSHVMPFRAFLSRLMIKGNPGMVSSKYKESLEELKKKVIK